MEFVLAVTALCFLTFGVGYCADFANKKQSVEKSKICYEQTKNDKCWDLK